LEERFEPLWRVPDLGGKIIAMRRDRKNRLHVVTENLKRLTSWTFDHPSCTLRAKRDYAADFNECPALLPEGIPPGEWGRGAVAISEEGDIFEKLTAFTSTGSTQSILCQIQTNPPGSRKSIGSNFMGGSLQQAAAHARWMAIPVRREDNIEVVLLDTHTWVSRPLMKLRGANRIAIRFSDNILLCGDDRGRILGVDIDNGKTLCDLRI
jgi:hypothetical protein